MFHCEGGVTNSTVVAALEVKGRTSAASKAKQQMKLSKAMIAEAIVSLVSRPPILKCCVMVEFL